MLLPLVGQQLSDADAMYLYVGVVLYLLLLFVSVFCVVSTAVCVSVVACCAALVVFAGIIIAGCNASVGVTGVHGGALMMSINCLSYFSGSTCRLIVLVLMILPAMPTIDSLVIVSFPNQIPL